MTSSSGTGQASWKSSTTAKIREVGGGGGGANSASVPEGKGQPHQVSQGLHPSKDRMRRSSGQHASGRAGANVDLLSSGLSTLLNSPHCGQAGASNTPVLYPNS